MKIYLKLRKIGENNETKNIEEIQENLKIQNIHEIIQLYQLQQPVVFRKFHLS